MTKEYVHQFDGVKLYIATRETSSGYDDFGVVRFDCSTTVPRVEKYIYWYSTRAPSDPHVHNEWVGGLIRDYEEALNDMGYTEYRSRDGTIYYTSYKS